MNEEITRIGIYSGTFAPIHNGHVNAANAFMDQMQLHYLFVIPTALSPWKIRDEGDDAKHRMKMCELAFEGEVGVIVSDMEIEKGGYILYLGGRWGKKVGRGAPIDYIFETEEEILSAIEKTILFYRENGVAGERFADTIARVGFSKAKEAVLSDEILKRKEEILKDE